MPVHCLQVFFMTMVATADALLGNKGLGKGSCPYHVTLWFPHCSLLNEEVTTEVVTMAAVGMANFIQIFKKTFPDSLEGGNGKLCEKGTPGLFAAPM